MFFVIIIWTWDEGSFCRSALICKKLDVIAKMLLTVVIRTNIDNIFHTCLYSKNICILIWHYIIFTSTIILKVV